MLAQGKNWGSFLCFTVWSNGFLSAAPNPIKKQNGAAAAWQRLPKEARSHCNSHDGQKNCSLCSISEAKAGDSGCNVPLQRVRGKKKKKKLCQHIFSELPCMKKPARIKWLFALYSKRRAVVSLCLQEPEIESLAAIESELENVAQKLHELRRGWERERETSVKKSWHGNLLFLLVLLRFTSCLVSTDRACEYVTRFNLSLSLFSRRIVPPALLPLFAPRCRSLPYDILSLT